MCSEQWDGLTLDSKFRTIRSYARIVSELYSCKFDQIGSLYFRESDVSQVRQSSQENYVIGPIAWGKMRSDIRRNLPIYDRGPWKSAKGWLEAALTDEIQFMSLAPEIAKTAHGDLSEEIQDLWPLAQRLYPQLLQRAAHVASDRWSNGPFFLSHADFSMP